jgi:hypothetical protein
MSNVCVTVDIDWASEAAIGKTLGYFEEREIKVTLFSTHDSPLVRTAADKHEVGLHPFFGSDSDHGTGVASVVKHILGLPHNIKAFRCHRFAVANESQEAMATAGMLACSNVCTDLCAPPPFIERNGMLEVPIFMEDGGYLRRRHSLEDLGTIKAGLAAHGTKVFVIHPMHFCLNSPDFGFMRGVKARLTRKEWNNLTSEELAEAAWRGRGIRDLLLDAFSAADHFVSFSDICHPRVIRA